MSSALFTAATGMKAQQFNVQTIANNLANVNTTGYKRQRAEFQDLLYQTIQAPGTSTTSTTQNTSGISVGLGTRVAATQRIFTQGSAKNTGRSLDVMIEGDGFFRVETPDGTTAYTRSGSFELDSTGRITTVEGSPLADGVTIPPGATDIIVGNDGTVEVRLEGESTTTQVGQISLASFPNASGLEATGRNMYLETLSSGTPTTGTPGLNGLGTLSQGFLELSNVELVDELVTMITAQRSYEINSRSITTADQMLETAVQLKR